MDCPHEHCEEFLDWDSEARNTVLYWLICEQCGTIVTKGRVRLNDDGSW